MEDDYKWNMKINRGINFIFHMYFPFYLESVTQAVPLITLPLTPPNFSKTKFQNKSNDRERQHQRKKEKKLREFSYIIVHLHEVHN